MDTATSTAPVAGAHSSRNRARRMKAVRAKARHLVDDARRERDAALSELANTKSDLSLANYSHKLEVSGLREQVNGLAAEREQASGKVHELESIVYGSDDGLGLLKTNEQLKQTVASLESERDAALEQIRQLGGLKNEHDRLKNQIDELTHENELIKQENAQNAKNYELNGGKAEELAKRLGAVREELDRSETEKEEFREEVLGLRSKMETLSGLSRDDVNRLINRAQIAEDHAAEINSSMVMLRNQVEDYERQLEDARSEREQRLGSNHVQVEQLNDKVSQLSRLNEELKAEVAKSRADTTNSEELQQARALITKLEDELETARDERDTANIAAATSKQTLSETVQQVENLGAELEAIRASEASLRSEASDNAQTITQLREDLERSEKQVAEVAATRDADEKDCDALKKENAALKLDLERTRKARADAAAALSAARERNELIKADLAEARDKRDGDGQKVTELSSKVEQLEAQNRSMQSKLDKSTNEYERKIDEYRTSSAKIQLALDQARKQLENAQNRQGSDDAALEKVKLEVAAQRERADRAEGQARAAEVLRDQLAEAQQEIAELTAKKKQSAAEIDRTRAFLQERLDNTLEECAKLKDDLADAESKLADEATRTNDAENRARIAERDSGRLSKELERARMKITEERSRADGAAAALQDADGVKSLALPHGLMPGDETTVALGSGFQRFRVGKIVYRADGTILIENDLGQSVPMGTWR